MSTQQMNKFYFPIYYNQTEQEYETIEPTSWNSLFIPSLPPGFVNEELLFELVQETFRIGSVKRVDIIKKNNTNNRLMAFIHFNSWNDSPATRIFRDKIEKEGFIDVFGYTNEMNQYADYNYFIPNIKKDVFIRFLINKMPIKDTELNAHQLADMLEKSETKIIYQQSVIDNLTQELEATKLKLKQMEMESKDLKNKNAESFTKLEKPKLIRNLYYVVRNEEEEDCNSLMNYMDDDESSLEERSLYTIQTNFIHSSYN